MSHIFSDKTGTLTCNIMDFRKFSVGGVSYGLVSHEHLLNTHDFTRTFCIVSCQWAMKLTIDLRLHIFVQNYFPLGAPLCQRGICMSNEHAGHGLPRKVKKVLASSLHRTGGRSISVRMICLDEASLRIERGYCHRRVSRRSDVPRWWWRASKSPRTC